MSYKNPPLPCRCGTVLTEGTKKLRVRTVSGEDNVPDWKVLDRLYQCGKCRNEFWHEVEAKPVEKGANDG